MPPCESDTERLLYKLLAPILDLSNRNSLQNQGKHDMPDQQFLRESFKILVAILSLVVHNHFGTNEIKTITL